MADNQTGDSAIPMKLLPPPAKKVRLKGKKGRFCNPSDNPKIVEHRRALNMESLQNAARAFEKYVEMGDDRSYPKLAAATGHSLAVINKWGRTFKWTSKVRDLINASISASVVEPVTEQMKKRKLHLRLIDFMLTDAAILNKAGEVVGSNVQLKSMQDVQRALETRESILNANQNKNSGGVFGPGAQIGQAVFIIKK
jgi:hypothetical protein